MFDTWATSSIPPFLNAGYGAEGDRTEQLLPMSLRHQAHEIIRTWAFYTIVRSLYHTGKIPWEEIMVSGFVLAKPGEKISKSKNNAGTSPQKLIAEYGADAIRYLAGGVRLGTDTYFRLTICMFPDVFSTSFITLPALCCCSCRNPKSARRRRSFPLTAGFCIGWRKP